MKSAAALKYFAEVGVPVLTAKAVGEAADRLVAFAREAGVPVVDDPIAGSLAWLETGRPVDVKLLGALAEIYAGLFEIDGELALIPRPPDDPAPDAGRPA